MKQKSQNVPKKQAGTNAETPAAVPKGETRSPQHVRAFDPDLIEIVRSRREQGESFGVIADDMGISKSTAFRYAQNIEPLVTAAVERDSKETSVSTAHKSNVPANAQSPSGVFFSQGALANVRKMLTPRQLGIFESQVGVSSQRQEARISNPYQNPGGSPLRQMIPNLLASRLQGAQDSAYLQGLGIDPSNLFGKAKQHDGSSTSSMLKEMREFSLTISMMEKMGGSTKNSPVLEQLKADQKRIMEKYEALKDAQHKTEIDTWKQKVENVRNEKNEIQKVKELLKDADPALSVYIRKKLGLEQKESIVDSLERLGVNAKDVWGWVKEFVEKIKGVTVAKGPPPPQSMPSEAEIAEKALGPEFLHQPTANVKLKEFDDKSTFGTPTEIESLAEVHLPSESETEEKPEPKKTKAKKKTRKKKPRKGFSTRELEKSSESEES